MARRDSQRATSAGAWIEHVRDRVNPSAVDREARNRIQLIVAGPKTVALLDALRSAGPFDDQVIRSFESLGSVTQADADIARGAVYCPAPGATNGALSAVASLPFPVFVVRSNGAETLGEARLATTPASSKVAAGTACVYYVSSLNLAELRKYVLPDIVQAYKGDEIALAAAIPAFRSIVAAKLTMDCAMNSLKIAAVSALADHIPVLGLITGSIASAGDTIAITALQMRMLLRIAAAYGKKPEFARILELVPVVGGGYGWRALAREASGFIPIAGIPIKAAVAYAGTLVVGQAASYYYETGLKMSPSAVGSLYREASERAKVFARRLIQRPNRKL
ncbi:MAG: hypothetical protein M3Z41_01295 [Candidatus Eremiobacteraeota bacterium]|nr:hypothetical protein [Candidatus Eremiobacteraeota bacterium]